MTTCRGGLPGALGAPLGGRVAVGESRRARRQVIESPYSTSATRFWSPVFRSALRGETLQQGGHGEPGVVRAQSVSSDAVNMAWTCAKSPIVLPWCASGLAWHLVITSNKQTLAGAAEEGLVEERDEHGDARLRPQLKHALSLGRRQTEVWPVAIGVADALQLIVKQQHGGTLR